MGSDIKVCLSKSLFSEKLQLLIDVYPSWNVKVDTPRVVKAWYDFFQSYSDKAFELGIDDYIRTSRANPTVTDLILRVKEFQDIMDNQPSYARVEKWT